MPKIKESPLKSVLKELKNISFEKEKIKLLYFVAYYLGINIDSVHYFSLGNVKALQVMFDAVSLKDIPGSRSVIFFNLLVKVVCPLSGFFFFHYFFSYYYCQKLEHKEYALSLLILSQDLSHRLNKHLLND